MRLNKIYTKLGDQGFTQLVDGQKISKKERRIEAYGTVDELNASIAVLNEALKQRRATDPNNETKKQALIEKLTRIQNQLFDLGGELATPQNKIHPQQKLVQQQDIARLEKEIDDINTQLSPLSNFILPGGCLETAYAHLARTICRRAERRVVELYEAETIRLETIQFLNRLSDWLFVMSRHISQLYGAKEQLWQQEK